jgi:Repeat of Unknown Function (DUF347)
MLMSGFVNKFNERLKLLYDDRLITQLIAKNFYYPVVEEDNLVEESLKRETPNRRILSKVSEVTLVFWVIKIFATTLGETGGSDAVSTSMNLGYLVSTGIFAAIFNGAVMAQISAKKFHPLLYWFTITASDNS